MMPQLCNTSYLIAVNLEWRLRSEDVSFGASFLASSNRVSKMRGEESRICKLRCEKRGVLTLPRCSAWWRYRTFKSFSKSTRICKNTSITSIKLSLLAWSQSHLLILVTISVPHPLLKRYFPLVQTTKHNSVVIRLSRFAVVSFTISSVCKITVLAI